MCAWCVHDLAELWKFEVQLHPRCGLTCAICVVKEIGQLCHARSICKSCLISLRLGKQNHAVWNFHKLAWRYRYESAIRLSVAVTWLKVGLEAGAGHMSWPAWPQPIMATSWLLLVVTWLQPRLQVDQLIFFFIFILFYNSDIGIPSVPPCLSSQCATSRPQRCDAYCCPSPHFVQRSTRAGLTHCQSVLVGLFVAPYQLAQPPRSSAPTMTAFHNHFYVSSVPPYLSSQCATSGPHKGVTLSSFIVTLPPIPHNV